MLPLIKLASVFCLGALFVVGKVFTNGTLSPSETQRLPRVEAETAPRGEVREDKSASGGKYVHVTGEYQPLIFATVPPQGDAFTIWARLRGISAQLKGTPKGSQKDYEWSYDKSVDWRWVRLGRHTRAELGDQILLIRGAGSVDENAGIDAVILAPDAAFEPDHESDAPRKTESSSALTLRVDWSKQQGTVGKEQFSLNLYAAANPKNSISPDYRSNIAYMGAGILRLHNGGMMQDSATHWEGLLDTKRRTWDSAKVKRLLASLQLPGAPKLLVNIPGWPDWMDADKDGFLDKEQFTAYAKLCADLVKITNKEGKFPALYWEPLNEKDDPYFTDFHQSGGYGALKDSNKPDRWDEIAQIYTLCAVAMKQVDPTIKIGGPAAARPDLKEMHQRFIAKTLPHLDFFSFHAYASGSAADPDDSVYDKAKLTGSYVGTVRELLQRLSPKRPIPVMLGEYNISWTWETRDPRMTSSKGAVYDALVMIYAIKNGVFSAQAWNEKDGIYGKTDDTNKRRPGAEVLHLFNTLLIGTVAETFSREESHVVGFAVVRAQTKTRSLLLVNRTDQTQTVQVTFLGKAIGTQPYQVAQVTDRELKLSEATAPEGDMPQWVLPANSVTIYTFKDALP